MRKVLFILSIWVCNSLLALESTQCSAALGGDLSLKIESAMTTIRLLRMTFSYKKIINIEAYRSFRQQPDEGKFLNEEFLLNFSTDKVHRVRDMPEWEETDFTAKIDIKRIDNKPIIDEKNSDGEAIYDISEYVICKKKVYR